MRTRSSGMVAFLAAGVVASVSTTASAHTGNFVVYRTSAGQLQIKYSWTFPTFLDETLPPYRGDVFNVLVERLVIPSVALDQYPPNQGTQIYMEVVDAVPQLRYREAAHPTNIIFGPNVYFCGTGGTAWNTTGIWIHADQFHPQWDWDAPEWYVDVRVYDSTGVHTPSPVYRMRVTLEHYCGADFTDTAIVGSEGYGVPNHVVNTDDFFVYLTLFAQGSWRADLTTTALVGGPGYGDQDGLVTNDDFFYFLSEYVKGCHY